MDTFTWIEPGSPRGGDAPRDVLRDEEGQSVVEYALLLATFLAIFLALDWLAQNVLRDWFSGRIELIAGPGP